MNDLIEKFWKLHPSIDCLTSVELTYILDLLNSPINDQLAWAESEVADRWNGSYTLNGRTRRPRRYRP